MTHATHTAAHSANAAATRAELPRRPRLGAAIASAVVTCTLLGSIVLGMTATAPDGEQIVALDHLATRT